MNNLFKNNNLLIFYVLLSYLLRCPATEVLESSPLGFIETLQYADVAGMGEAIGHGSNSLTIDVKNYWMGCFPTSPIKIDRAFSEWDDDLVEEAASHYSNMVIVFFATTNVNKSAIPPRPISETVIWDPTVTFTNFGGYCPARFVQDDPPTWFALETNDVEHLNFFSNIVESVVAAKDKRLFYTTARDAIKADESGEQPYKGMSFMPLLELIWEADETNLVEMINDPLLTRRLRVRAMGQLKKRFDWPATNTIPEL